MRDAISDIMDIDRREVNYDRVDENGDIDQFIDKIAIYFFEVLNKDNASTIKNWRNKIFLSLQSEN